MTPYDSPDHEPRRSRLPARLIAGAGALVLAAGLAACAPEPGTGGGDSGKGKGGAGQTSEEQKGNSEGTGSWPEQNKPEVTEKQLELPASFPKDQFVIPDGAKIDDTGERSEGQWYLVLRAADRSAADTLWDQVVAKGGFTASNEAKTADGGRSAALSSPALSVDALTLPQSDGSVLLSFDISRAG
ncbi:hypothetical protein JD292_04470 [Leucobacter sp. CSA2]|uniref:Uncharacterized protein n=1 Tax=Leucobacter edaphi TaxID=2796472 RepID=A0A934QDZ7_9MICO|nr:hypothetical protein [Leucobacter edaphi]MBK0421327.1 hypothetical protein [Leucobacter edaphi]